MGESRGGSRGSGPPFFGPRCRPFNIGPKIGPLPEPPFLLVDLRWTPFQKSCISPCGSMYYNYSRGGSIRILRGGQGFLGGGGVRDLKKENPWEFS